MLLITRGSIPQKNPTDPPFSYGFPIMNHQPVTFSYSFPRVSMVSYGFPMVYHHFGLHKSTFTSPGAPPIPGIQSDVTDLVNRDGFAPAEIKKRHGEELRGLRPLCAWNHGKTMGK